MATPPVAFGSDEPITVTTTGEEATSSTFTTETRDTRPRGLWPQDGKREQTQSAAGSQDEPFSDEEARRFKLPQMGNWLAVRVLSHEEGKRIRTDMRDGLKRYGKRADQFISASTRDGTHAFIWSNIPDGDLDELVDAWLELGKVNKVVAQAARGFARTNKLLNAGLILGAKALETQQHYMLHGFEAMGLGAVMGQMMMQAQTMTQTATKGA